MPSTARERIASSVSCASASCALSLATSVEWADLGLARGFTDGLPTLFGFGAGAQIQAHQQPFGIRQIADQLLHRRGQAADQGGDGEDLISARQLRVAQQIDDLDLV